MSLRALFSCQSEVMRVAKFTANQLAFVEEYLADLNATQTTIKAGYSHRYKTDRYPKKAVAFFVLLIKGVSHEP